MDQSVGVLKKKLEEGSNSGPRWDGTSKLQVIHAVEAAGQVHCLCQVGESAAADDEPAAVQVICLSQQAIDDASSKGKVEIEIPVSFQHLLYLVLLQTPCPLISYPNCPFACCSFVCYATGNSE